MVGILLMLLFTEKSKFVFLSCNPKTIYFVYLDIQALSIPFSGTETSSFPQVSNIVGFSLTIVLTNILKTEVKNTA